MVVALLLLGNFYLLLTLKNHPQSLVNTGQNGSVGCPPLKETLALFLGDVSDYLAQDFFQLFVIVFAETFCIFSRFGTEVALDLIPQFSSSHHLRYKFH